MTVTESKQAERPTPSVPVPQVVPTPASATGRLAGKVCLVTGAAGNLGGEIVRHYLREGATVVLTGREPERNEAAREAALAATGVPGSRASTVRLDGADPASVTAAIAEVVARHGRLDVVVNNAGSAGPRQPIHRLPLTDAELAALVAEGATDTETVPQALRSILGVAWHVARAAAEIIAPGGSIINVSTIFSRTEYYGRAAYVVPKAAMNAFSRQLSFELGAKGIRVNTVYPGPIRSERIDSVFATMDRLKGDEPGTTGRHFTDLMSLARSMDGEAPSKVFPTPRDVAATCVFLGSDESAAFNGHDFEITHGMWVRKESRNEWVSRPTMRTVDGHGTAVLVAAGDQVDDALGIARLQAEVGAEVVLAFRTQAAVREANAQLTSVGHDARISIVALDRDDPEGMEQVLAEAAPRGMPLGCAIVLPAHGATRFTGPISAAPVADIEAFLDDELAGAMALARALTRYWAQAPLARTPRFVMLTNDHDGAHDAWADLLRSAMEELARVWRDETTVDAKQGRRSHAAWGNQVIRYTNRERENLRFAAGQAARLLYTDRRIRPVNLYLPASIVEATGARRAMVGHMENLTGLHMGKVALITGGSAGIGGQVARLLAMAGAKLMLCARRESELEAMRAQIVGELEDVGYSGAERRVRCLAGFDVGDLASLRRAVEATVEAFGRVDYLLNNAGVAGAEEMVVDMPLDAWRYTLDANLVSNFGLLAAAVPQMRRQGTGYIVNVSSYFGGEKHLAVAYPNRSDYAVSKAGQRAMVESMAKFLGPEIQVNAIAPGPVDGDRLRGVGGKPGLFDRRGRLILENKRLNAVHAAIVHAVRRGLRAEALLARLAGNDVAALATDPDAPHELRELAEACRKEGGEGATWGDYLLTPGIAARLLERLRLGGWLLDASEEWVVRTGGSWLRRVPPDDRPFLPAALIGREAEKVRKGVTSQLHLRRMPTESEVALATVFFLADRAVSGETFMPSGGLNVERSITERELFGSAKQERLDQMKGRTVWLIGEHLVPHLAEAARQLHEKCHVGRIVLLTRTPDGAAAIQAKAGIPDGVAVSIPCGDNIEAGMDAALRGFGAPTTVVSTPFVPLPDVLFGATAEASLDTAGFRQVVEDNLTHHFRVARKASLLDGAQLVLVSPDVPQGADGAAFALANFVKTTLHAFTATIAVENERLVHDVPVNQINLTRRVRSEEPRNEEETLEEVRRFARAVLLAGAPLPDAEDSRYRSRIYRGMAMTV